MTEVEVSYAGERYTVVGPRWDDYIVTRLRSGQFYEQSLLDTLAVLPWERDGIAVDVGANIGNHTTFFASVLGMDTVSIEPEAKNIACLEQTIIRNNLGNRVQIHRLAASDREGQATLEQSIPNNSGAFRMKQQSAAGEGSIKTKTLDQLLDPRVAVDLIKIDVEGAEKQVLSGAKETIEAWRPVLCIEAQTARDVSALLRVLSMWSYTLIAIEGLSDNLILAASGGPLANHPVASLSQITIWQNRTSNRRQEASGNRMSNEMQSLRSLLLTNAASTSPTIHAAQEVPVDLIADVVRQRDEHSDLVRQLEIVQEDLLVAEAEAGVWKSAYQDVLRSRVLKASRMLRRRLGRTVPASQTLKASQVEGRARKLAKAQASELPRPVRPFKYRRSERALWPLRDPVRIGIASIPEREASLKMAVESLYGQADEICVWLNGYKNAPDFLLRDRIRIAGGSDLGDRGKFAFLDGYRGFYITADDDIQYPDYYVESLINGLEKYGRKAVVSWHGSQIREGFSNYYDRNSRRVLTFGSERGEDEFVDILGTGCTAFHTDTVNPNLSDFPSANMADIYFSRLLRAEAVAMVVLAHQGEEALALESPVSFFADFKSESGSRKDVGRATTQAVLDDMPMRRSNVQPIWERELLRVAIVGRTDQSRWKKGGILKSTHATASMLKAFGCPVSMHEISTASIDDILTASPDVCIVYPGDPERPDFTPTLSLMRGLGSAGIPTLVNLSDDTRPERRESIRRWFSDMEAEHRFPIRPFVFAADFHESLPELRSVVLPKSIVTPRYSAREFEGTRGVFVGDLGKLSNRRLFDFPVEDWLNAIRVAVPDAPLFAVEQYKPVEDLGLELEVVSYSDDIVSAIGDCRVMVSPFRYCTFEMLPVELAASGLPVLYRSMPQSLNAYLGPGGVSVASPSDLETLLPALYNDPGLWRSISRSGAMSAQASDYMVTSGVLYLRLVAFVRSVIGE